MVKELLTSDGNKRTIASGLGALVELLRPIPGFSEIASVGQTIAAALGAVGIGHAVVSGNSTSFKISTLGSIASVLLLASHYVPFLAPIAPILTSVLPVLGGAALGIKVGKA